MCLVLSFSGGGQTAILKDDGYWFAHLENNWTKITGALRLSSNVMFMWKWATWSSQIYHHFQNPNFISRKKNYIGEVSKHKEVSVQQVLFHLHIFQTSSSSWTLLLVTILISSGSPPSTIQTSELASSIKKNGDLGGPHFLLVLWTIISYSMHLIFVEATYRKPYLEIRLKKECCE